MDLGLSSAASGLETAQASLSVWANDLANANTTAFASSIPIAGENPEIPVTVAPWPGVQRQGPNALDLGTGASLVETQATFGAGTPVETGIPTDVALNGPGFFVVRTPAGSAYTRDGSFSVDAKGTLVNPQGDAILSTTGKPILAGPGPVSIGPDGTVTRPDGTVAGEIAVATFPNPAGLLATGANLYVSGPDSGPAKVGKVPAGTRMMSGLVEGSGTDTAQALVGVITASESFDLNTKSLSQSAQLLGWAAGLT